MSDIKTALQEFVATYNDPKVAKDIDKTLSYFPELKGFDKNTLSEYIATYEDPKVKGDWEKVNSYFPEFFADNKTQKTTTPKTTAPEQNAGGFAIPMMFGNEKTIAPDPNTGIFTPEIAAGLRGEVNPNPQPTPEPTTKQWLGDLFEGMGGVASTLIGNTIDLGDRLKPENLAREIVMRGGAGKEGFKAAEEMRRSKATADKIIADQLIGTGKQLTDKSHDYYGIVTDENGQTRPKDFTDLWSEGNYAGAFGNILLEGGKSLPTSVMAFNPVGLGVIGAGSFNEKYNDVSANKDVNMAQAVLNATGTASFELLSERLGALIDAKILKRIAKTAGAGKAKETAKAVIYEYLKAQPKEILTEGVEEAASQLAENITDIATGVKQPATMKDSFKMLFDNVLESGVYGMGGGAFGGATMGGSVAAGTMLTQPIKAKKQAETTFNDADRRLTDMLSRNGFTAEEVQDVKNSMLQANPENRNDVVLAISQAIPEAITRKDGKVVFNPEIGNVFTDFYIGSDKLQSVNKAYNETMEAERAETIRLEKENAAQELQRLAGPDGMIRTVKLKDGTTVQVRGESMVFDENGMFDMKNSSTMLYYTDEAGQPKMMKPYMIESLVEEKPIEQAAMEADEQIDAAIIEQEIDEFYPTQPETYETNDGVIVVAPDEATGTLMAVPVDPATQQPIGDPYSITDAQYAEISGKQLPESVKTLPNEPINDGGEPVVSGDMTENEPEAAPKYPVNKKGEVDVDAMTVAQTYQYMVDNYGQQEAVEALQLQEKNTQAAIQANIKATDKFKNGQYSEVKKATTIQEQLKIREKHKATAQKLTDERAVLDAQLAEIRALMPQVEQAPAQPEVKPVTTSNVRPEVQFRREQEAKAQEQANLDSANETLTPNIDSSVIEVRAKEEWKGTPQWNRRLINLGDAMTVEDVVLRRIAGGAKFVWTANAPLKGMADELGFANKPGERELRKKLIDNENGMTPQEFAHVIFESGDLDFMPGVEYQDVYNAVLDTLLSVNSATDAMKTAERLRDSRDFSMNEQAEWDSMTEAEMNYLESIPDDILESYLGITNFSPEQLDIIQNLQNEYYGNDRTTTEASAVDSTPGIESETTAAGTTEEPISKEQQFDLTPAENFEQFEANVSEILKQYSGREMAFVQVELYLNEKPEFGKQFIDKHGITNREELRAYTGKLQAKLREGKGKERSEFLKSEKEAKAEKAVSEIEAMALKAEADMQEQLKQSESKPIKNGDTVTYKGKQYTVNGIYAGNKEVDLEDEKGNLIHEEVPVSELNKEQVPMQKLDENSPEIISLATKLRAKQALNDVENALLNSPENKSAINKAVGNIVLAEIEEADKKELSKNKGKKAKPKANTPQAQIQQVLDNYDNSVNMTMNDVINDILTIAYDNDITEIQEAYKTYETELREDREEFGERGDREAIENNFMQVVNDYMNQSEQPLEKANPIVEKFTAEAEKAFGTLRPAISATGETGFYVQNERIEAQISINNEGAENYIYIARIDANNQRQGAGTNFINKLKQLSEKIGSDGIFSFPETEQSRAFHSKNGFEERENGMFYWDKNQSSGNKLPEQAEQQPKQVDVAGVFNSLNKKGEAKLSENIIPDKVSAAQAEADAALQDFLDAFNDLNSDNLGIVDNTAEKQAKMLVAGTKMVGAYTKLGVYKFADLVSKLAEKGIQITEDLLSAIKKSYGAFAAENDIDELDDMKTVRSFKLSDIQPITKEKEQIISTEDNNLPESNVSLLENKQRFINAVVSKLGNEKLNIVALRKIAEESGFAEIKDTTIQEYTELAIIMKAHTIVKQEISQQDKYNQIVELYEAQPTISMRSSERIAKQQYSTPIPLSFLAGEFVNKINPKSVLEPSAGNGMMVFNVDEEIVIANEIDEVRLDNLRDQGFKEVTNQDGTLEFNIEPVDGVITNPPFGKSEARDYEGYKIAGLDEQMVVNALSSMADHGRAAIIIGGHTKYKENGTLASEKSFLNYLYDKYNVVDIINVDGGLYSKQGTTFPVRLILINGRRTGFEALQRKYAPLQKDARSEQVSTFDELYKRVKDNENNLLRSGTSVQPDSGVRTTPTSNGATIPTGTTATNRPGSNGQGESGTTGNRPSQNGRPSDKPTKPTTSNDAGGTNIQPDAASGGQTVGRSTGRSERRISTQDADKFLNRGNARPEPLKVDLEKEKTQYPARSKSAQIGSVVPTNVAQTINEILHKFDDIDAYVQTKLGYESKDELFNALAAEQIDSVALAIYQIENGKALIIGDMTGVGKGRQAAAIIRYAVMSGKRPIFITEKPQLFSDIYRDLRDIGSADLNPFILNSKGNEDPAMTDENGVVIYNTPKDAVKKQILESGKLPEEYDYAVLTYSQLNGNVEKKGLSAKQSFFRSIAADNILVLDESHNAGGEGNTGTFMTETLPTTKGVVFLSGTFAKRADNMPIYAMKTSMNEANMSETELIEAIKTGGIPLQEIMSKNLTETGQMVRRERDFTGVTIDWQTMTDKKEQHWKTFDGVIELFNELIKFQKDYIDPVIEAMNDDVADVQGSVDARTGTRELGISNQPFASKTFNLVRQMLFSLKAQEVADEAIKELKAGNKPVIAIGNTMETFINDIGAVGTTTDKHDYSLTLVRGLTGLFRVTETDANGERIQRDIDKSIIGAEGLAKYAELEAKINKLSSGISISPIDVIKAELSKAGYSVGEMTGRTNELVFNEDGTATVSKRTNTDKKKLARDFNSGNIDVLILNQSASTGISLHASNKFKDQRKRVMLFAQNQLDVNTEVQMRGRIDRTGQVQRGAYRYIISPIPAEQRMIMMFKAKLKSLDANTTSSQKSKTNEIEVVDFLNKYGDEIVIEYLKENPDINLKMLDPFNLSDKSEDELAKITSEVGAASKAAGRAALLSVKEQEAFYNEITEKYNTLINYLNDAGANDLEITTLPLKAETKSKHIVIQGKNSGNPFSEDSVRETVEVDVLKKPMNIKEVNEEIQKLTEGKTAVEYRDALITKINDYTENQVAQETQKIQEEIGKKQESFFAKAEKEADKGKLEGEARNEFMDAKRQDFDAMMQLHIDTRTNSIRNRAQTILHTIKSLHVGKVVLIPSTLEIGTDTTYSEGMFLGFRMKEKLTPSTITAVFATLDGRRRIDVPLSKVPFLQAVYSQTMQNIRHIKATPENWDSMIPTRTRKTAYIITGNILQAYGRNELRGQLVSYSTVTGEIRQGILLPDKYKSDEQTMRVQVIDRINDLRNGQALADVINGVTIRKETPISYSISVPLSKVRGGKYFLDAGLRELVYQNDFRQMAGQMVGMVSENKIEEALRYLSDKFNISVDVAIKKVDENIVNAPQSEYQRPQFQAVSPIGFYSTVEKALEAIQQERGTKDQFRAMLLKNGAKQAEMDWMGFDELPEKLTKADIHNWIDENRIEVEEMTKGEITKVTKEDVESVRFKDFGSGSYVIKFKDSDLGSIEISTQEADNEQDAIKEALDRANYDDSGKVENKTKFSQYVLPGGENYKELLLTMPVKNPNERYYVSKNWDGSFYVIDRINNMPLNGVKFNDFAQANKIAENQNKISPKGGNIFRSSHFDETNILAHVRFNERTVNGERVLFIEEFQSDFAQTGKKKGYKGLYTIGEEIPVAGEKNATIIDNVIDSEGKIGVRFANGAEMRIKHSLIDDSRVPDMPFKKTDQWVNLAARRMIRYAAENGFDRIAWTNGEQQADRYDLSKSIKEIEYSIDPYSISQKDNLPMYQLKARDKNDNPVIKGEYAENELENIVGKELAKKIVNGEGKETVDKTKSLTGIDLKVGGEGMKAFYDAIVPSAMRKLGKPFGSKVENIDISSKNFTTSNTKVEKTESGNFKLVDDNGNILSSMSGSTAESFSPADLHSELIYLAKKYAKVDTKDTVQSIPVTDSMKQTAMAGMPLFAPTQTYINFTPEEIKDETKKAHGSEEKQQEGIDKTIAEAEKLQVPGTIGGRTDIGRPDELSPVRSLRTVLDGFKESGYVNFNGTKVSSHQDIADLWSIHRSPYIEKSHVVFIKDGKIAGSMAMTSGKIGLTHFHSVENITKHANKLGATQVYFLHNHPSGNPSPSGMDIKLTYRHADKLLAEGIDVLGHVIVDHDKYAFIDTQKTWPENLDYNTVERVAKEVELFDYKESKQQLYEDRDYLGNSQTVRDNLFMLGRDLLSEPTYKAAIVYMSSNKDAGFSLSAYDILPNSASAADITRMVAEGLNKNLGQHAVIIHNGQVGYFGNRLHQGVVDVINLRRNDSDNFLNENIDQYDKDTLWVEQIIGEYGARNLDAAEEATIRLDNLRVAKEMNRDIPEDVLRDSKGNPIIFYHGTQNEFNIFDNSKIGSSAGLDKVGHFFTTDKWEAEGFAYGFDPDLKEEGFVKEVNLSIKNPLTYEEILKVTGKPIEEGEFGGMYYERNKKTIEKLIESGKYDGIIIDSLAIVVDGSQVYKQYTPAEIRLATGFERGVDGLWRYEVPDGNFKNIKYSLSEIPNDEAKLSDIWDDDKLFTSYPQLKDITVKINNNTGYGGSYIKESNTIEINLLKSVGKEGQKTTLIHEIQHAIQEIEGFAKGGNLKSIITLTPEEAYNDGQLKQYKKFNKFITEDKILDSIKYYETLEGQDKSDYDYVVSHPPRFLTVGEAEDRYNRLAGEVEARNASARMNFTADERRQRLLSETADVAPEDQIVLMDAVGVSESRPEKPQPPVFSGREDVLTRLKQSSEYAKELQKWQKKNIENIAAQVGESEEVNKKLTDLNKSVDKWSAKLWEGWADGQKPVKKWQEFLKANGVEINDANDYSMRFTMMPGRVEYRFTEFDKTYLKPFIEILKAFKDRGVDYDALGTYAKLKHADEYTENVMNQKMAERGWSDNRINLYKLQQTQPADVVKKYWYDWAEKRILNLKNDNAAEYEQAVKSINEQRDRAIEEVTPDFAGKRAIEERLGMSAEQYIADIESIGKANGLTDMFWKQVKRINEFSLMEEVRSGRRTSASAEQILSTFQWYVPLKNHYDMTAEDTFDYSTERGQFFVTAVKRGKGRRSESGDPFSVMVSTVRSSIGASEENVLKQALLRLAELDTTGSTTVSKAWFKKTGEDADGKQIFEIAPTVEWSNDDTQETYNEKVRAFEMEMQELAAKGEAYRGKIPKLKIGVWIKPANVGEHEVHVMRNGEMYVVRFNTSPRVPQAVNKVNYRYYEGFTGAIFENTAKLTRFMAATKTMFRPTFIFITNPLRDIHHGVNIAYINRGAKFTAQAVAFLPIAATTLMRRAAGKINVNNKYDMALNNYMLYGAKTGISKILELKQMERSLKSRMTNKPHLWSRFKNVYQAVSEVTENQMRFAVYLASLKNGDSTLKAVSMAKQATVNFDLKGNGRNGLREISSLYAFVRVGFQAIDGLYSASTQSAETKRRFAGAVTMNILGGMVLTGAISSLIYNLFKGDDDEEDGWINDFAKLSTYERNSNFLIWTPDGVAKYPLGQEFRVFHGLGMDMLMLMHGKATATETAINFGAGITSLLPYNPIESAVQGSWGSAMPDATSMWFELAANRDWMGTRIYKENQDEDAPGYMKVRTNKRGEYYASEFMYRFSKALDKATGGDEAVKGWFSPNPDVTEHLVGGYLNGLLAQTLTVADGIINKDPKEFIPSAIWKSKDDIRQRTGGLNEVYYDVKKATEKIKNRADRYEEAKDELNHELEKGLVDPETYNSSLKRINNSLNALDKSEYYTHKGVLSTISELEAQLKANKGDKPAQQRIETSINELKEYLAGGDTLKGYYGTRARYVAKREAADDYRKFLKKQAEQNIQVEPDEARYTDVIMIFEGPKGKKSFNSILEDIDKELEKNPDNEELKQQAIEIMNTIINP